MGKDLEGLLINLKVALIWATITWIFIERDPVRLLLITAILFTLDLGFSLALHYHLVAKEKTQ